jgi:hypothetical protein
MAQFINKTLNFLRPRRNVKFYSGKLKAKPSTENIDEIHSQWFGRFDFLENNNNYMEWLFPIYGSAGMNPHTSPLSMYEAELIRNDKKSSIRVVKSYKLMLNFFGMKLEDDITGKVAREENLWEARYCQMNSAGITSNKISRMLKSLYQLGFERYQKKFVEFIGEEMEEHGLLGNLKDFYLKCWKAYIKTPNITTDESIFFNSAENGDESYNSYQQSEQKFLKENDEKLKAAYEAQKEKVDLNKLYCKDLQNKALDSTSYFKRHYNSPEEEQQSRIHFLESIKKSRDENEQRKTRALQHIKTDVQQ